MCLVLKRLIRWSQTLRQCSLDFPMWYESSIQNLFPRATQLAKHFTWKFSEDYATICDKKKGLIFGIGGLVIFSGQWSHSLSPFFAPVCDQKWYDHYVLSTLFTWSCPIQLLSNFLNEIDMEGKWFT